MIDENRQFAPDVGKAPIFVTLSLFVEKMTRLERCD